MRSWNIALIGALMIGALVATVAHDRFARQTFALSDAHAASDATSRTAPARHDDRRPPLTLSEADYGWGPVRTTDW
jgi:hypothetical protein